MKLEVPVNGRNVIKCFEVGLLFRLSAVESLNQSAASEASLFGSSTPNSSVESLAMNRANSRGRNFPHPLIPFSKLQLLGSIRFSRKSLFFCALGVKQRGTFGITPKPSSNPLGNVIGIYVSIGWSRDKNCHLMLFLLNTTELWNR